MDKAEFLAGLLKGLTQYTNTLAANDDKGFTEHYDKIRGDPKHLKQSLDVASLAVHASKNRYRNVLGASESFDRGVCAALGFLRARRQPADAARAGSGCASGRLAGEGAGWAAGGVFVRSHAEALCPSNMPHPRPRPPTVQRTTTPASSSRMAKSATTSTGTGSRASRTEAATSQHRVRPHSPQRRPPPRLKGRPSFRRAATPRGEHTRTRAHAQPAHRG